MVEIAPPLPETGWSRKILTVRNAVVVPPAELRFRPACGVWCVDADVPEAAQWRGEGRFTRPVENRPPVTGSFQGRHIWGGVLYGHFGHFVAESLSRLWIGDRPDVESIIFVPKFVDMDALTTFQADLFRLLAIRLPIRIVREPTMVEELLIPGQGFGLGRIGAGTPEFRNMMRRMAERIVPDGPECVYISRSRYFRKGNILNEAILERNLERQGYVPIHPQEMPIERQLAIYRAAKRIIGVDSSAFHCVGFVAHEAQKIGMILRRSNDEHVPISLQLAAMAGTQPTIINALDADWIGEGWKRPNHMSWGELNHRRLARELAAAGFIDPAVAWDIPAQQAPPEDVARATAAAKRRLIRRPAAMSLAGSVAG